MERNAKKILGFKRFSSHISDIKKNASQKNLLVAASTFRFLSMNMMCHRRRLRTFSHR